LNVVLYEKEVLPFRPQARQQFGVAVVGLADKDALSRWREADERRLCEGMDGGERYDDANGPPAPSLGRALR
jgi:hypothetical protein